MVSRICVNLPVKHLDRSVAFFGPPRVSCDPQFTDRSAACWVIAENIRAFLARESEPWGPPGGRAPPACRPNRR